jgi:hypothetical protein
MAQLAPSQLEGTYHTTVVVKSIILYSRETIDIEIKLIDTTRISFFELPV